MKTLKYLLVSLGIAASICSGSAAHAVAITDIVDPAPDITITPALSYTFTHDITDGLGGYVPNFDSITGAFITVTLTDMVNKGQETFTFTIGSSGTSQVFNNNGAQVPNGNATFPYTVTLAAALPDLIADGKLTVLLSALSGDYIFKDSLLSAEVTRGVRQPPGQVPEPATALLLGIGLASLGLRRKNKRPA